MNDIAFTNPKDKLAFITCGDDTVVKVRLCDHFVLVGSNIKNLSNNMLILYIQVWDVLTGANLFSFEGHHAPVYSVCPHEKDAVRVILNTSMDLVSVTS